MHAQGFDVELKQYPAGWRANFYPTRLNDPVVASAYESSVPLEGVFLSGEPATGEDIMPSEHDKIDSQKVIGSLNTILELELAGVVRYLHYSLMVFGHARIPIIGWMRNQATEGMSHAAIAGEHVTSLGGHPSLNIGKLVESHKHDITQILGEALDHERATLREYYNLLALVVDKSVWLEEYAREQITLEEQHIAEVDKMMRKPGELHPTR